MKKILLVAIGACLIASASNAQNLKQSGNEKNLQVLFAPLGGNPIGINGISFRKFNATGTSAWRLNLFIGYTSEKEILHAASDTNNFPTSEVIGGTTFTYGSNPEAVKKTTGMTFGIRPGYEKHFAGTERLSPYIGAELLFSTTSATTKTDSIGVADVSFANTATAVSAPYTIYTTERKGDGGSTTFGLNLIAGMDFYFTKSLSLGAELGFGWSSTSMPDIEDQYVMTTVSSTATNTTVSTAIKDSPKVKQGSSMQIGPNAVGQIKLGWLF